MEITPRVSYLFIIYISKKGDNIFSLLPEELINHIVMYVKYKPNIWEYIRSIVYDKSGESIGNFWTVNRDIKKPDTGWTHKHRILWKIDSKLYPRAPALRTYYVGNSEIDCSSITFFRTKNYKDKNVYC